MTRMRDLSPGPAQGGRHVTAGAQRLRLGRGVAPLQWKRIGCTMSTVGNVLFKGRSRAGADRLHVAPQSTRCRCVRCLDRNRSLAQR